MIKFAPRMATLSNLAQRSIVGLIFSVAVIGCALLGPLANGMLFLFFAAVGLYEVYELLKHQQSNAPRWFKGMSIGVVLYMLVFLVQTETVSPRWFWILPFLIAIIFVAELIKLDHFTLSNLAITIFGWIYVIMPLSLVNVLPMIEGIYDATPLIGFFLVLWANDTGAYFIGKYFGRRKLYPEVSPNKTWEGLAGGAMAALAAAIALSNITHAMHLRDWLVMAVAVASFGNLGDLFESHLKRNFGVKDSGHLMPGHGGVLDRFDGLFLALPVFLAYYKIYYFL
jgi:phosphatidate cytidylyltransferase